MSDAASDEGSDINQDDTQEELMTPAELIATLEEVSALFNTGSLAFVCLAKCCQRKCHTSKQVSTASSCRVCLCGRLG